MPQFDNFKASISVNGVDLPEYGVTIDEEKKLVTCWVPSQVGKSFALNWNLLQRVPYHVCNRLRLDGQFVGSTLSAPQDRCRPVSHSTVLTSSTIEQGFVFSSLDLDDDDDDECLNLENIKELGNIQVEFCRCKLSNAKSSYTPRKLDEQLKVHERAKKGMAQRVKLGEPISVKPRGVTTITNIVVLWTLIFKYRSIDTLRADGIVPSDPVLKTSRKRASEEDAGAADVDEEEAADEKRAKELRKELQAVEDRLAKKVSVSGSRPRKRVKIESSFVSGEVIDLT